MYSYQYIKFEFWCALCAPLAFAVRRKQSFSSLSAMFFTQLLMHWHGEQYMTAYYLIKHAY